MTATPMDTPHKPDEIVITGAGLATCLGSDRWTTWRGILDGQCGVRPLTALESSGPHNFTGGQALDLPDVDSGFQGKSDEPREVRYLRHVVRAALSDARLATDQSNLHPYYEPTRCALVMGTTLHGMRNGGAFLRTGRFEHLKDFLANSTLQQAVESHAIGGPRITTCSACSSGLASVILGMRMLQNREADLVAVGGYDPISEYAFGGFRSMRLESEGGVRPFSYRRDGMKVAEGYACLLLERADHAFRRDAKALARIAGYGEACDAFHLSKPHPQGDGAARAARMALTQAGIKPSEIDLIVAHATGTRENDASEYAAISQVFGESLSGIPATAFKGHLGHTLGGAGAVELVLSATALDEGVVPPCVGVDPDDLEFDLHLQTHAPQRRTLRHVLNLSLGFGGANACVILGSASSCSAITDRTKRTFSPHHLRSTTNTKKANPDSPNVTDPSNIRAGSEAYTDSRNREVLITGVGVVLPGAVGNEAFLNRLQVHSPTTGANHQVAGAGPTPERNPVNEPHRLDPYLPTVPCDEEIALMVSAQRARRMSRYARLCIAATTAALQDAGMSDLREFGHRCAVFVASLHGPAEFCETYYRQIIDQGLEAANPSLFAEGVPNVGSAHLSTHFRITGFCQSIIGTRTAGLDALRLAVTSIQTGVWDRAFVCAADEITPLVSEVYHRLAFRSHSGNGSFIRPTSPLAERDAQSAQVRHGAGAVCLVLESAAAAKARRALPRGIVARTAGVSWPVNNNRTAIKRIAHLWDELESTDGLLYSAAGADWTDRLLQAGLREWSRRKKANRQFLSTLPFSTVYGRFPDVLSALPLADLAATLLRGRLPVSDPSSVDGFRHFHGATGNEKIKEVNVLAIDLTASASGVRVRLMPQGGVSCTRTDAD
jgi:3-oxoacyl-[acyl-carrier-protein] synthase II